MCPLFVFSSGVVMYLCFKLCCYCVCVCVCVCVRAYWCCDVFTALCSPVCLNGGTCVGSDTCNCPHGFYGLQCEHGNPYTKHYNDTWMLQCVAESNPRCINVVYNTCDSGTNDRLHSLSRHTFYFSLKWHSMTLLKLSWSKDPWPGGHWYFRWFYCCIHFTITLHLGHLADAFIQNDLQ